LVTKSNPDSPNTNLAHTTVKHDSCILPVAVGCPSVEDIGPLAPDLHRLPTSSLQISFTVHKLKFWLGLGYWHARPRCGVVSSAHAQ